MSNIPIKKEWIDWQNTKVLQKTAVVDEKGNILVIKRSTERPGARPGKWDLPGGSLGKEDMTAKKPNESAILREIQEETKLNAEFVSIVFADSWVFTKSMGQVLGLALGYVCSVKGVKPSVTLSDEHTEYQWLTREDAINTDFGDDGGLHINILKAFSGVDRSSIIINTLRD